MSYDFAGGSLKLKGVSDKIKKKKKSKKDKEKLRNVFVSEKPDVTSDNSSDQTVKIIPHTENSNSNDKSQSTSKASTVLIKAPTKTKSELAYERSIERRMEDKILKKAELSHKERVEIYNKNLDQLSEYNDIPKVSWTK